MRVSGSAPMFFAVISNVFAVKDSTTAKTSVLAAEEIPAQCKKIVLDLPTRKYSSLCIYPDLSYQNNQKLSLDFFSQKSKKIVTEIAGQIEEAIRNKKFDQSFFQGLMTYAGERRSALALKQKSENAEDFGRIRSNGFIATPLGDDQYRNYQSKLLGNIWEIFQTYKKDLKNTGVCFQQKIQNLTSYVSLKILDVPKLLMMPEVEISKSSPGLKDVYSALQKLLKPFFEELYQQPYALQQQSSKLSRNERKLFNELMNSKKEELITKVLSPFIYLHAQAKISTGNGNALDGFEWVSGVLRDDMNSKNPKWDRRYLSARIQAPLEIKDLLSAAYSFFTQCAYAANKEEFASSLSSFQYLFSQASPYVRGTGAIVEWFMQALCEVKGYACSCNCGDIEGKCSLDLAVFTSLSISEYADLFSKQMSILHTGNQSVIDLTGRLLV